MMFLQEELAPASSSSKALHRNPPPSTMSPTGLLFPLLLLLLLLLRPATAALCHSEDKQVLLRIKSALNNPYLLTTWNKDSDCCKWYGVECHDQTHRVVALAFQYSDLPMIPSEVGDVTYLQELIFHKLTNLTGPIPPTLTKLKYLKYLTLSWLNLTGPIPSFLSQIKSLTYLDLSYNKLTGEIPDSLSTVPGLSYIRLDRNQLTGNIPASLADLKGNNVYLLLSHNNLSGEVPVTFSGVDFGKLDLSRNRLQGDGSLLFGANKTNDHIDISRNLFEFNLSKVELTQSITWLDISHNKIYGAMPEVMTGLRLQFLNVSYNRLCGEIPVGGRMQSFDFSVYFHNRCLCGAPLDSCT